MRVIKHALIYNIRKKKSSLLMILLLCLVFLGELYGLCLYFNAKTNEQNAFEYNGYALRVDEIDLDKQIIEEIKAIPHVTFVDYYAWYDVSPTKYQIVCDHTGSTATSEGRV